MIYKIRERLIKVNYDEMVEQRFKYIEHTDLI